MDAAIYATAGLVALWVLRPLLVEALQRPRLPAAADNVVPIGRPPRKAAAEPVEDEVGPYPRLAARVADVEHAFKLLQNEWQDKESRVDSLLKRLHRLRKLDEGNGEPESPPAAPLTREAVLARFRQQQGGQ